MRNLLLFASVLFASWGSVCDVYAYGFTERDSAEGTEPKASKWSLQTCIEYALEHNLNVSDQVIGEQRAQNAFDQDRLDRYPILNASASHNYNFGRTIDPFTNQFINQSIQSNNFALSSSVTLFNGSRITNTIKRSENEVMRSKLQRETTQNQIALNVADAFLQIIFAEAQLANFQEINKSTQAQLERAKALFEGGAANKSQYLSFKAQDARDQMNIQTAKGSIRTAYVRLRQILQTTEEFEIETPDLTSVPTTNNWSLPGVLLNSSSTVPDVRLAESQIISAELSQKIAKSGLYPRLSLFGNVNSLYSETRKELFNPTTSTRPIGFVEGSNSAVLTEFTSYETKVASFGKQIGDNFGQSAGLSLTIPIFNNNQVRANVTDAKLSTQLSRNNLERTKNTVQSNIIQAYTDYENALANYQSAVESEKAQGENYEFARKSYEAGATAMADMLLALNDWSRAKNDVERAKFQLVFSNTVLHYYNTGEVVLK
ncbi:MAG: TolC family protein [Bacteroidia bacterium]|nr:TolC family protein [Bacteroidia bacterium]